MGPSPPWPQGAFGALDRALLHPGVVEVQLQVGYQAAFGQRLAVVSSLDEWEPAAAEPMAWMAGDVWTAVLSLPIGGEVEYKYVLVDEAGRVVRWQEGANNRLSLRHPGALVHVTDTWTQHSRQVHEVGLPVSALPPHLQQRALAGAAAAMAAAQAAQAAMPLVAEGRGASAQLQGARRAPPGELQAPAPALQNNIMSFGSERAAAALVEEAAPPAGGSVHHVLWQQQQQQQQESDPGAVLEALAAEAAAEAAAAASAGELEGPPSEQQLSRNVAELLALLQGELQQALAALAQCPADDPEQAEMLAEGRAVLAALRQQQDQLSGGGGDGGSAPPPPPTPPPVAAKHREGGGAASLASASEDEIAAALLSDDCEEACFCLVDAICSCMEPACSGGAAGEPCESVAAEALAAADAGAGVALAAADAGAGAGVALAAADAGAGVALAATGAGAGVALAAPAAVQQQLQQPGRPLVVDEAVRAAAFADVQHALQQSADLLSSLADPCHPLVIQADREVAHAKRQLGHLLAA